MGREEARMNPMCQEGGIFVHVTIKIGFKK